MDWDGLSKRLEAAGEWVRSNTERVWAGRAEAFVGDLHDLFPGEPVSIRRGDQKIIAVLTPPKELFKLVPVSTSVKLWGWGDTGLGGYGVGNDTWFIVRVVPARIKDDGILQVGRLNKGWR
jgi:hypothetical protein